MMKKFICYLFIMMTLPIYAGSVITKDKLPKAAIAFLDENLKDYKIVKVEIQNSLLETKAYRVVLEPDYEVFFDGKGIWYIIDFDETKVPNNLIPKPILDYVDSKFEGDIITQIEQSKGEYNVELQSDVSLLFDKKGKFLKINY